MKVSIIIPAFNSEKTISSCLRSIQDLDYPKNEIEVIVVDNGSMDNTIRICEKEGVLIVSEPDKNVGGLRNSGAEIASGEILAFTDSDCLLPKQWLKDAICVLKDMAVGAVGGGCLAPEKASWVEKAWVIQQTAEKKISKYLPACNFIVRKDLFDSLGGFDENIVTGEDDELSIRLCKKGLTLVSIRSCYVIHLGYPKTLLSLARKEIWHGANIIENSDGVFDKMLIFTHVFMVLFLCLVFFIIIGVNIKFFVLVTIGMLLPPALTAGLKTYRSDNKKIIDLGKKFFQLFPIYTFFFIGRGVGLLFNYWGVMKNKVM